MAKAPKMQLENENDMSRFFLTFTEALFARIAFILDLYTDRDFTLPVSLHSRKAYIAYNCNLKVETVHKEDFTFNGIIGDVLMSGSL